MEENKKQKLNEFGMPEISYEATKKALERPKVWTIKEMIEAKAKCDEQIKELKDKFSANKKIDNIVPKNGTWLCNVNNVSLQMEVYWKEATQEESAGFYMRPMQGQEIKVNNHLIENVCQLTV